MKNDEKKNIKSFRYEAFLIWMIFLTISLFFIIINSKKNPLVKEISYNEFIQSVRESKIDSVTFKGNEIIGKYKDSAFSKGENFKTYGDTKSDHYLKILDDNKIVPKYLPEEGSDFFTILLINLIPIIFVALFFIFVFKGLKSSNSKLMSFGKLNMISLNNSSVKFSDVAGMDEAKEELTEIVDFLKNPAKYSDLGGKIPKGALLIGPPGTGKTMIAKATANEAGVPFFAISGSDFIEMFVGIGASRVRDMFEQARKSAPAIIFIDEIDAVAKQRSGNQFGSNSEMDQTLNQLLVEMDGIDEKNKQIIVLAATNRADILDQALLRPGRFDRRIHIPLPDIAGRVQILKSHSKNKKMSPLIDFDKLAKGTAGMSGADISNLLNEAAIFAAKNNKKEIDMESIEKSKDKILMGTERRSLVTNPLDRERTAFHESGHALVTKLLKLNTVYKVSIIPRGNALGVTQIVPDDNQTSFSKSKSKDYIKVLLAGRAAEEIIYGEYTTGASDDIKRATKIARRMISEWGFSDLFGPINLEENSDNKISDDILKKIDYEVIELLEKCYRETFDLIKVNIDNLKKVASLLQEKETISGDEI